MAALGDALAAASGHDVNRPGLNAFIDQSQARNGLVSEQTEQAMLNAQKTRDQMDAASHVEDAMTDITGDPKFGRLAGLHARMNPTGNWEDLIKSANAARLSNPDNLTTPVGTASQAGFQGKLPEPVSVPNTYTTLPGAAQPNVQMTPQGQAQLADTQSQTAQRNAIAKLDTAHLTGGGFAPRGLGAANLDPAHMNALQQAVADGRLDPTRINGRNASIYAEMEMRDPGNINYNRMHADAALQANPTFQQRAITLDTLPVTLQHMTELGKKIGYSDNRTVGKMQQFMNGEFNDPDYAEYMAVRNDALMTLAGTMRGQGMSDQAHRAEIEAAAPTMSPMALDGYLKGQMAVLEPRLNAIHRATNLGQGAKPTGNLGTQPAPAPVTTETPAGAALPPGFKVIN